MLSSGTCEQAILASELCQISNGSESDCPVTNAKQYAILFGGFEEEKTDYLVKNPKHKLPVLVLFFQQRDQVRLKHPPRIYTTIWEDGTIVWGIYRGSKLIANDIKIDELDTQIQYFQSKVDSNEVKKLIAGLAGDSIWTRDLPIIFGVGKTRLIVGSEGKMYSMAADGIDVSYNPLFYGSRIARNAREWRRVIRRISDMIPKEGHLVNISFERYNPNAVNWSGIVGE